MILLILYIFLTIKLGVSAKRMASDNIVNKVEKKNVEIRSI